MIFSKLMEEKDISRVHTFLALFGCLAYTACYVYSLQFMNNPFPNRKFPLYVPPIDKLERFRICYPGNESELICFPEQRYPWL